MSALIVEITAFRLESKSCKGFEKKSTNETTQIITSHVIYNLAYTYKFNWKPPISMSKSNIIKPK